MVQFSDLPGDIVSDVFRSLSDVQDSMRFASVCKQWSSVVSDNVRSKPFSPWLMLATLHNDSQEGEEGGVRICYSFLGNKLFRLRLPELQGRKGWGTPHGWLLTLGLDMQLALFHPFTHAKISLPPPRKFTGVHTKYSNTHHVCETFIVKVAISCNPSDSSPSHPVVVMVIYGGGGQVSFASPGDDSWTQIKINVDRDGQMVDIIFFNGSFYCLSAHGIIYVCDITNPLQPSTSLIAPVPENLGLHTDYKCKLFLVEISGHLYIIKRRWRQREEHGLDPEDVSTLRYETLNFDAYEFDLHARKWKDSAVKDFNGHAILVGNNTSCAISTVDHPELKPDCIYFTDDHVRFYRSKLGCYNDMGVYDFKNKVMMEPFYEITESQWCSKFSRPFFFVPTLK